MRNNGNNLKITRNNKLRINWELNEKKLKKKTKRINGNQNGI
jgi:hypothetical protein